MALWLAYGGTFDPFHHGHLAIAREARDTLAATVRLMPAADPPHRDAPGASAEHRARMLEEALADETGLVVDRRELGRNGPSYSVDTVRGLRAELGDGYPVALLVGADSFAGLAAWHEWEALLELAHFVVADRPGSPLEGGVSSPLADALEGRWTTAAGDLCGAPGGRVLRLGQPLHGESASAIRRDIAAGRAWQDRVPAAVARYIVAHGLYGAQPEPGVRRGPDAAAQQV